jgi:hypothetical protein
LRRKLEFVWDDINSFVKKYFIQQCGESIDDKSIAPIVPGESDMDSIKAIIHNQYKDLKDMKGGITFDSVKNKGCLNTDKVKLHIDYEEAEKSFHEVSDFHIESICAFLSRFSNEDVFVPEYQKRMGMKKYVSEHWEEILTNALSSVPAPIEQARQENLRKYEGKLARSEKKRKRKLAKKEKNRQKKLAKMEAAV